VTLKTAQEETKDANPKKAFNIPKKKESVTESKGQKRALIESDEEDRVP